MSDPIRVLVADDHQLFRDGVRALLQSLEGTEVVGEAAGGEEAIRLALELEPDIVLMDIQMPGVNGVEATRRILAERPDSDAFDWYLFYLRRKKFEQDIMEDEEREIYVLV